MSARLQHHLVANQQASVTTGDLPDSGHRSCNCRKGWQGLPLTLHMNRLSRSRTLMFDPLRVHSDIPPPR